MFGGIFMENINVLLESLISNLKEGIHIVNSQGKTIYYNDAMGNIEGVKKEDVMGKEIHEYLKGMEEDSTITNCLQSGTLFKDSVQNYSNDKGKVITSINSTIPVRVGEKIEAVIEIARDNIPSKRALGIAAQLIAINGLSLLIPS